MKPPHENDRSWNSSAAVLKDVLPHLPFPNDQTGYRIWEVWDEVVGQRLAPHSQPMKLQAKKLFVMVSHSTWLQELHFMKTRVRVDLNRRLGSLVVKDLLFFLGQIDPKRPIETGITKGAAALTQAEVPPLGKPKLEAALADLLAAQRRRAERGRR